jgi:hypothetical protein
VRLSLNRPTGVTVPAGDWVLVPVDPRVHTMPLGGAELDGSATSARLSVDADGRLLVRVRDAGAVGLDGAVEFRLRRGAAARLLCLLAGREEIAGIPGGER